MSSAHYKARACLSCCYWPGCRRCFPKLVGSRTYAERMFRVMTLDNLNYDESREAIAKPLDKVPEQIKNFFNLFSDDIYDLTKGYPYFIQFWCRELYDYLADTRPATVKKDTDIIGRISRKLDMDFFEARWARLTNRQRDLLSIIAQLENSSGEFTVQEIVAQSKTSNHVFSGSHVNQMLNALFRKGMIFKNRHGKYVLAVPLLDEYIRRRMRTESTHETSSHD